MERKYTEHTLTFANGFNNFVKYEPNKMFEFHDKINYLSGSQLRAINDNLMGFMINKINKRKVDVESSFTKKALEYGIEQEPIILNWYAENNKNMIVFKPKECWTCGNKFYNNLMCEASVDGLALDVKKQEIYLLEIKAGYTSKKDAYTKYNELYKYQVSYYVCFIQALIKEAYENGLINYFDSDEVLALSKCTSWKVAGGILISWNKNEEQPTTYNITFSQAQSTLEELTIKLMKLNWLLGGDLNIDLATYGESEFNFYYDGAKLKELLQKQAELKAQLKVLEAGINDIVNNGIDSTSIFDDELVDKENNIIFTRNTTTKIDWAFRIAEWEENVNYSVDDIKISITKWTPQLKVK